MTQGPGRGAGAIPGAIVTGILTILFGIYAADLVIRFCPRGEDCEITGQLLFAAGMIVSFAIAWVLGFATRGLVERWQR